MKNKFVSLIYLSLFLIASFQLTSAIAGCCLSDGICENGVEQTDCPSGSEFSTSKCEFTSFCKKGCCIHDVDGACDSNTIKGTCESAGGEWSESNSCNQVECKKGCCSLSNGAMFLNERECEIYTEDFGLGTKTLWDSSISEYECVLNFEKEILGACTSESSNGKNSCQFVTNKDCFILTGSLDTFVEGKLCTSPELNTTCERTEETTCSGEKVYFKDTCGNIANIYDSSKINEPDYWNAVVSEDGSCGANSGNGNSKSCGNCNRALGGICTDAKNFNPDYGENYCKPTSCIEDGINYKNGESWCVYESAVGEGRDIVGSAHYVHTCVDGVIDNELCGETRGKVCVQSDTTNVDGETVAFKKAACEWNPLTDCFSLNEEFSEESRKECSNNALCFIKGVKVDNFEFDMCLPTVPKGLSLMSQDQKIIERNEELCSIGTQTCNVVYQKKFNNFKFNWECVQNCQCEKETFTKQMNDFCKSLGDCGGGVNILGEYTERGYEVSRAPRLGRDYIENMSINNNHTNRVYLLFNNFLIGEPVQVSENPSNFNYAYSTSLFYSSMYLGVPLLDLRMLPGHNLLADKWGLESGMGEVFVDLINPGAWLAETLFGLGDTKIKPVSFTCQPWQPPKGGDDCSKCNENPDTCTDYKCSSLGAACQIINKGEVDEMCQSITHESVFPQIIKGEAPEGLNFIDTYNGYKIESTTDQCVMPNEPYNLTFKTDEPSQCVYFTSFPVDGDFENGKSFGTNSYVYEHKNAFVFPDLNAGRSQGINISNEFELYILCSDMHGNIVPTSQTYKIETCVYEGQDKQPPRINKYLPSTNTFVGYNTTEVSIKLYTNELAECKYATEPNRDYSQMTEEFSCEEDLELRSLYGYECNASIPISSTENSFYIKCQDQPWLNESKERATNSEDQIFILRKVSSPIKIDVVVPSEDLETKTDFKDVEIKVQTSGGGSIHECYYKLDFYNLWNTMYETGERIHRQEEITLPVGNRQLSIMCEDETGDIAKLETTFRLTKDDKAPKIARILNTGSSIKILTTEDADCRYSSEKCKFNWDSGETMGSGREHTFSISKGEIYYIKCKDEWENSPRSCSLIIGG